MLLLDWLTHKISDRLHRLFVVTNKRLVPTLKILNHLRANEFFLGIHSIDQTNPPAPSKTALTGRVIIEHFVKTNTALLVGDSQEDAIAAQANDLHFVFAAYGYGHLIDPSLSIKANINCFSELLSLTQKNPREVR
jgi:phosphoglycolate phosphatase-like HAD superfamily hydrolase